MTPSPDAQPGGPPDPELGTRNPEPASKTPPKPEDRAVKSGEVKVRVAHHSLFEGGRRYNKGEVFITTRERAKGLAGLVDPV